LFGNLPQPPLIAITAAAAMKVGHTDDRTI